MSARPLKQYYSAVCACIKDEPDLEEWIAYNLVLGFEHIFLYDHMSVHPLEERLEPLINRTGRITVVPRWNRREKRHDSFQVAAYNDFLERFGPSVEWVAYIDGDEFIALKQHDAINAFIREYESDGADSIALHWRLFGANGHDERPVDLLVTEAFTAREGAVDRRLKRIIRPSVVKEYFIHFAHTLTPGAREVDVMGRPIEGPCSKRTQGVADVACIHHYHTRSRWHWEKRLKRGQAGRSVRTMHDFNRAQTTQNATQDRFMIERGFPDRIRALLLPQEQKEEEEEEASNPDGEMVEETTRNRAFAAVCATLKNELDVCEWTAYHYALGFRRFVLYDNESDPPLRSVLERGLVPDVLDVVEVRLWPPNKYQKDAYNDFLQTERERSTCEWAAFIDGDEFIALKQHDDIESFLRDYDPYDIVALQWHMFTANGHRMRPDALIIEAYTKRTRTPDAHLKRIVRPDRVNDCKDAYMVVHNVGCTKTAYKTPLALRDVDTLKRSVSGPTTTLPCKNALQIACVHHYHLRSLQDWYRRLRRGQPNTKTKRTERQFWRYEKERGQVIDTTLANSTFPDRVRALLVKNSGEHETEEPPLIVSLTTTSYRLDSVAQVISSLLHQTLRPARIVLWVSEDPYLYCKGVSRDALPSSLQALVAQHSDVVQVQWTPNIGPYRKLLPTVSKWPNARVLTVDDDTVYARNMVEHMVMMARVYPDVIIANRVRRYVPRKSYVEWPLMETYTPQPVRWCLPTGVGGVLYPPGSVGGIGDDDDDDDDDNEYLHIAPRTDDIWFRLVAMRNGVDVVVTGKDFRQRELDSDAKLYDVNMRTDHNLVVFGKVCAHLGLQTPTATRSVQRTKARSSRARKAPARPPARPFASAPYWEKRYAQGGTSGTGSYGDLAKFKADVVNAFCSDRHNDVNVVVELGVGDGNQASLLTACKDYYGVDVSATAVQQASRVATGTFHVYDGTTKGFAALALPRADLVLSMDVIFHLVEDSVFEAYMQTLWSATDRYLIVYSSDKDDRATRAQHVRHRQWTKWFDRKPDATIVGKIAHPLPHDSPSHFTIICKQGTDTGTNPSAKTTMWHPLQTSLTHVYVQRAQAETYARHANALITIVKQCGEPLEGNILFRHGTPLEALSLDAVEDQMRSKRHLLQHACSGATKGLEIGFNSGFSLLLFLVFNANATFIVFDTFEHSYTRPCYEYLCEQYPDRLKDTAREGDSTKTLKAFASGRFDFFHVDGGHSYDVALSDLQQCARLAQDGAVVVLDDYNMEQPRRAWQQCVKKNLVRQCYTSDTIYKGKPNSNRYRSVCGAFDHRASSVNTT